MRGAYLFISILLLNLSPAQAETKVFFSPNGGCESAATQLIDSAKKSLEIAVYSLNNPKIINSIESAISRGVSVRILTDRTQAFGKGNLSSTKKLAPLAPNFRVHTKNRIMHNKFMLADASTVMTGSFNWTTAAQNKNDENCIVLDEPNVVAAFQQRFEKYLWVVNTPEKSALHLASLQSSETKIVGEGNQ